MEYHSNLSYAPGAMIFCQGAPADIIFWVVKGMVKETCPSPHGNRIMIRLATAGDVIGCADQLNEKGQWIRRFEAQAISKCVVSMITRQRVRELLTSLDSATLLEVSETDELGMVGMGPILRVVTRRCRSASGSN